MNPEIIFKLFFLMMGAITGSFLNVCIVRLPKEESIVTPRSHCVNCKNPIAWFDNIPFISYMILSGKCRYCKEAISFRYFLVELMTASAFLGSYFLYGLDWVLVPYLVMISCFIVATFVDFEHRIIPDEISVGGLVAGLVFSFFIPQLHQGDNHFLSLGRSLFGALVGGGAIYAMGMLGDLIFKKESMGGGDVKLMAMVGAFMGWKLALLAFFIAPFFGAIYGLVEKLRTKDSTIAYGPFLVLGSLVSLIWGDPIIAWIMSGYGLYR